MWRKRKASSLVTEHHPDDHRGKRWKDTFVVSSSDDEDQDENEDEGEDSGNAEDEWDIKCILDESRSQYLIDWGDSWSPTWVSLEELTDPCALGLYGWFPDVIYMEIGAEGERQRRRNQDLGG